MDIVVNKNSNNLKCHKCECDLVKSNLTETFEEEGKTFYQEFYCFNCNTLYVCSSQSGDYVQEYLDPLEL